MSRFENHFFRSSHQDIKLWDSFQDPPIEESSESSIDTDWVNTLTKVMKVFTYWLVFAVVAFSSVLSKLSFLMMTSHVAENSRTPYCDSSSESTNMVLLIDVQCFVSIISAGKRTFGANSDWTSHRLEVGSCFRICCPRMWHFNQVTETLVLQEHQELYVAGIRNCFHLWNISCSRDMPSCFQGSSWTWRHSGCHVNQLFVRYSIDFV